MPNTDPRLTGGGALPDFADKGQVDGSLVPIQRDTGAAQGQAAASVDALAARVGAFGDQMAKVEGKAAGAIAGQDPNYRPDNSFTIRGQALQKEATSVYSSQLVSNFQSDAWKLLEDPKISREPAAFNEAYLSLKQQYDEQHVFPEIKGAFDTRTTDLGTALRRQVFNNWDSDRADAAKASLVTGLNQSETTRAQLLAIDPNSPDALREYDRTIADDMQRVSAMTDITDVDKAKRIAAIQNDARVRLITAQAMRLGTPDQIDAFNKSIGEKFAKGEILGLNADGFDTLQASLSTLSTKLRVQGDRLNRELSGDLDNWVQRAARGETPPASEWDALQQKAKPLGARGQAALDQAQAKAAIGQKINAMSVPEADAYVRSLAAGAKAAPNTTGLGRINATYNGPLDKADNPNAPSPKALYDTFTGLGATPNEALVLTSAAASESGLNPQAVHDGGIGYGLFGHNKQRLAAMRAFAGTDHPGWQQQAAFALQELRSRPEAARVAAAKTAVDLADAEMAFEQPKDYNPANPAAGHNYTGRLGTITRFSQLTGQPMADASGLTSSGAAIIDFARGQVESKRQMINTDPLGAAERQNVLTAVPPLDLSGDADALAASLPARMQAAETVASLYQRAPQYLRPDERQQLNDVMNAGGDQALAMASGIIRGAGGRGLEILKEIGGDAPAMAQAGLVMQATGNAGFARDVAEGLRARRVPGAKPATPDAETFRTAERDALGTALAGMDPAERQRTQAAVQAWFEVQAARQNIDVKDASATEALLAQGFQMARGMTRRGDARYGGVADYNTGGWFGTSARVQVPPEVRAGQFQTVMHAITDDDLKALPNPPVRPDGKPMTAADLLRFVPVMAQGGYRFRASDTTGGDFAPVRTTSGAPFLLPWATLAPVLRSRLPAAFE